MRNLSKTLFVFVAVLLMATQSGWASEKIPKPLVIDLKDSPTISFSTPRSTLTTLSILPNRNTTNANNITAQLLLTTEGCIAGYKGALNYNKSDRETLFNYFSTETPWSNNGTLKISQDKHTNELSITLNGETIKVHPQGRANFLRIEGTPPSIIINSVEPANN